ncbi:MAG: 1-acyl-sn-glycerol-3-phosphate acyltransferase [Tannerella sp.]|nr:1-acyl-sn-glycerol-3-phosphate acyltransferase [Tannerella sp.]
MHRIADNECFPILSAFVYPDRDVEEVKKMIRQYTTIGEFQYQVMKAFNEQVIARTVRRFSQDGLENLNKEKRYLYVSNHRDIVMDASLLQYALYCSGHSSSEITFGSNLMSSPFIIDIGKSNKMFKVIRGGSARDFYTNSLHLSGYIYHTIIEKGESVWIAQRNGRTKNGIDATDQAIIKMFYMSHSDNPAQTLAALNIVPVSISYQWEPCDVLKALELYHSRSEKYIKKPGEDLHSVLTGITQYKGDVHITVGNPLSENDLNPLMGLPNNQFNKGIALLIDNQVRKNYKLTCNNYIAHDIRSQSEQYASNYTQEEKEKFIQHYRDVLPVEIEDEKSFEAIFLGIYANPVDSK